MISIAKTFSLTLSLVVSHNGGCTKVSFSVSYLHFTFSASTRMLSPPRKEPIDVDDDENSSSDDEWDKVPRVGSEYQVNSDFF